jgi:hypothetical protein
MSSDPVDRRALRREYKETTRPAGLFAVRNTVDDRLLVGTSVDLPGMLNRQRFQLQMKCHPDKALQADYDRLGADAFSFEVLDRLEPATDSGQDIRADLATLRDIWLAKLLAEGRALYPFSVRGDPPTPTA